VNPLTKIGKYDVVGVIGRGGMGIVYKATDPHLGRHVAIKMMTVGFADNPELLKRFSREAQSTASLQHPNIVTVYDSGSQDGNPYLVMEYLEGESLDAMISSKCPLTALEKMQFIVETCRGLSYAHGRGIVHRDIKPANIMVLKDGGIKIVDFGIAHIGSKTLTRTGQIMGSVNYMSPEQINGQPVDAGTDIFSTGVVLYQLFTHALPFEGENTAATLLKIIHDPPLPLTKFLPVYPPELEGVVLRALAKNRVDRYSSADEFAMDLSHAQERLKEELVIRHLKEAEALLGKGDLNRAKDQLLQVVKIDQKHTRAVQLLRSVQQRIQKEHGAEQARELRSQAEDACSKREFSAALQFLDQAIGLDPRNEELQKLRERVRETKLKAEELQRALRRAETAHQQGNLDEAKQAADEALAVAPNDTQAKALYRMIHRDLVSRSRQRQVESLLDAAHKEINARNLTGALNILKQAEALDPQGAQVCALIEEVRTSREQEQQRKKLETITREVEQALNRDDFTTASARVDEGLRQFPRDHGLVQLKELAERQRSAAEQKLFVRSEIAAVRQLLDSGQPREALARLRVAIQRVPQEPQLGALLTMLQDRVARDEADRSKARIFQEARDALGMRAYKKAIEILEAAQVQFVDSDEIDDLLRFAREQDLKESGRRAVEDVAKRAQQWISEHEYERAVQLLDATLLQVPDDQLSILVDEARRRQDDYQRDMQATITKAQQFLRDRKAEKAIGFLAAQPASYTKSPEFRALVEAARRQQVVETVELQVAEEPEMDCQVQIFEEAQKKYAGYTDWQQKLQPVRERRKLVLSVVERARNLERAGKYGDAVVEWQRLRGIHGQYPGLGAEIERLQSLEAARVSASLVPVPQTVAEGKGATQFFGASTLTTQTQILNDMAEPQEASAVLPEVVTVQSGSSAAITPRHGLRPATRRNLIVAALALAVVSALLYRISTHSSNSHTTTSRALSPAGGTAKVSSSEDMSQGSSASGGGTEPPPATTVDQGVNTRQASGHAEPPKQQRTLPKEDALEKPRTGAIRESHTGRRRGTDNPQAIAPIAVQPPPSAPVVTQSTAGAPASPQPQSAQETGSQAAQSGANSRAGRASAAPAVNSPPATSSTATPAPSTQIATNTVPRIDEKIDRDLGKIAAPKATQSDDPTVVDQDRIKKVLESYRLAFQNRDQVMLRRVWPTITDKKFKELGLDFKSLEAVQMTLSCPSANLVGDGATVSCAQDATFKVQGQMQLPQRNTATFRLVKKSGYGDAEWIIDRVDYGGRH
jgi:tetratricopeptide (TPR) repeat protein/predicted Ser/Thr protein kinase